MARFVAIMAMLQCYHVIVTPDCSFDIFIFAKQNVAFVKNHCD